MTFTLTSLPRRASPAIRDGYGPTGVVATEGSVAATLAALDGAGEAESAAPDQIVTPRAASHLGHRWAL